MDKYRESRQQFLLSELETLYIEPIIEYFKSNKVIITKLNHFLTTISDTQYNGYMQLSKDGNYMKITKKVPIIEQALIKSADYSYINKERERHKQKRIRQKKSANDEF